jgi:hypothetical protein
MYQHCGCRLFIHAVQAACSYSCSMPPRRSRLRMFRAMIFLGGAPICLVKWWLLGGVERAVSEHGEQDVGASSGQADQGLVVSFAFADLPVVVGAGCRVGQ